MKPTLSPEQIARLLGPQPVQATPAKQLTNGRLLHSPLADDVVRDIRRRWSSGEPLRRIANDHGVTMAAVSLIGSRQRRNDVK